MYSIKLIIENGIDFQNRLQVFFHLLGIITQVDYHSRSPTLIAGNLLRKPEFVFYPGRTVGGCHSVGSWIVKTKSYHFTFHQIILNLK